MISMEYPRKKISRIKNPFESSEMIDSEYSDSRLGSSKGKPNDDQRKFPNVFQFNDRSRVMVSDSDIASSINNESGQNIFNFYTSNKPHQKVQEIQFSEGYRNKAFKRQQEKKQNRFSFNPDKQNQILQDKERKLQLISSKSTEQSKKSSFVMSPQKNEKYDTPQVKMFTISERPSQKSSSQQNYPQQIQSQSKHSFGKSSGLNQQNTKTKQFKKTFKPRFFQQFEEQYENQSQKSRNQNQSNMQDSKNYSEAQQQSQIHEQNKRMSLNHSKSYTDQFHQEIQNEVIDIFVSQPVQKQSTLMKQKLKANILRQEKMNLSAGSQVHSQTQNILNHIRDQINLPSQQIYLNLQTHRTTQGMKKDINGQRKIVESKIVHEDFSGLYQIDDTKMNTSKKPRKKIFQPKTQKSSYRTTFDSKSQSPYVSQFDKSHHSKQRQPSSSQILMKSLNIIDKMANKKTHQHQKQSKPVAQSVKIVSPASLTFTQSPNNAFNVYTPSVQQMSLQKEILQLNFQISSFETTFDLEKFDKKDQIIKIKWINDASSKLFEKYKDLILSNRIIDTQNSFHLSLKKQILLIREAATRYLNLQEKYIQTKNILSSFEEQIKDILLLSSKQKYKKIKLLNEAIQVMDKTEIYLSLQIGKIPVLLKTFVSKEKLLLEQLRDWLKQCITKQSSV